MTSSVYGGLTCYCTYRDGTDGGLIGYSKH
jgi:hypothetical protein